MSPMQEIRFHMTNGDLANAYIEQGATTFAGQFQYIQIDGIRFDPSPILPQIAAGLAFEALLHSINTMAVGLGTDIERVDNINNDALVSAAAEKSIVSKMSLRAAVLVNGT